MIFLDHYRFKEGKAQKAVNRRLAKGIGMTEGTKIIRDPFECNSILFSIIERRRNRIAHRRCNESNCLMWKLY